MRPPPAERVRARLRDAAGDAAARAMPAGYQRLGRVLVLRLPEALRPHFPEIGEAWRAELKVETVLVRTGPISGELREPVTETIAGGPTETEVVEYGIRWSFDAARIMFAAGNRTERRRAGRLVRPGESVVDLFAGIGYFSIPAAVRGRPARVHAVEKNPLAVHYLRRNVERNAVSDVVTVVPGDNRSVDLPVGATDRVFLGYLPSAVPWVARAVGLVRDEGGWLHVHSVEDAGAAVVAARRTLDEAIESAGARCLEAIRVGEVKPYGPGRTHVVADAHVRPWA